VCCGSYSDLDVFNSLNDDNESSRLEILFHSVLNLSAVAMDYKREFAQLKKKAQGQLYLYL